MPQAQEGQKENQKLCPMSLSLNKGHQESETRLTELVLSQSPPTYYDIQL